MSKIIDYPKSDLYFINCLRDVLGLDPLHQGQEGDEHYLAVAKRDKLICANGNNEEDKMAEEKELNELRELAKVVNIKINGKLTKYIKKDYGPKPNYLGREALAYFPEGA